MCRSTVFIQMDRIVRMANYSVPQSSAGAVCGFFYVPHLTPQLSPANVIHPKFKTEMCKNFSSAKGCRYGSSCQFRHPDDPAYSEMPKQSFHDVYPNGSNVSHINMAQMNYGSGDHKQETQNFQFPTSQLLPAMSKNETDQQTKYSTVYPQISYVNSFPVSDMNNRSSCVESRFSYLTPHFSPANVIHPKFKTEMCKNFNSARGCRYGSSCQFRHPDDLAYSEMPAQTFHSVYKNGPNGGRIDTTQTSQLLPTLSKNQTDQQTKYSTVYPQKSYVNSVRSSDQNNRSSGVESRFSYLTPVSPANGIHPKFKTEMCKNFNSTRGCRYGSSCQFRHPDDSAYPEHTVRMIRNDCRIVSSVGRISSSQINYRSVDHKLNKQHIQFLNEKMLPKFIKLASKVPKNGMRRHNSADTIGHFTYIQVSNFKKRLNEEIGSKSKANYL